MGPPLSERPPVPTESQRLAAKEADRAARDVKQAARGRTVASKRATERRKLAEIAREEQRAESALHQAMKLKREEAELVKRRQAAELLVRYEMLDKVEIEGFATRLSAPIENQISAKGVTLADHIQHAQTSLEQGRRFEALLQRRLKGLKKELGSVIEPPQEQIRLQTVLPAIRLMIEEAELKVGRLERYLNDIRGQEHQLRDVDAKLLQNAQGATQPEDFAWVNIIKALGLTENEKKAARLDLHKTGPTTAAIIKNQKTVKKVREATHTTTPKVEQTDTAQTPPKMQTFEQPETPNEPETSKEPGIAKETVEKSEKGSGMFGWFGR